MQGAFAITRKFNGDITDWDTSAVKEMQLMFNDAKAFNQDLSSWDLTSCQDMTSMFEGAKAFNSKLKNWTLTLTNIEFIFKEATKFKSDLDNKEELWTITKGIAWVVGKHWQEPDKGIWEFRTEDRHFTFSKVLCWVAIDRAIKISKLFFHTLV